MKSVFQNFINSPGVIGLASAIRHNNLSMSSCVYRVSETDKFARQKILCQSSKERAIVNKILCIGVYKVSLNKWLYELRGIFEPRWHTSGNFLQKISQGRTSRGCITREQKIVLTELSKISSELTKSRLARWKSNSVNKTISIRKGINIKRWVGMIYYCHYRRMIARQISQAIIPTYSFFPFMLSHMFFFPQVTSNGLKKYRFYITEIFSNSYK